MNIFQEIKLNYGRYARLEARQKGISDNHVPQLPEEPIGLLLRHIVGNVIAYAERKILTNVKINPGIHISNG